MKLLVFGDLMEKINKEYDVSRMTAYSMASKIVNKCPKRLYINIMEWIQGDSISDIYISDYSIPMILSIWKSTDFLRALEVMRDLSQSKFEQAEFKIWEMRR